MRLPSVPGLPARSTARHSLFAFMALVAVSVGTHAADPVRDKTPRFLRDDFIEKADDGSEDPIFRSALVAKVGKQQYVLAARDLKNCMELVVPVASKVPRYSPFLWDSEVAYDWSGTCKDGLRAGAGDLSQVDVETGETIVWSGQYAGGQKTGTWRRTADGTAEALEFAASRLPDDLAASLPAEVRRLQKQIPDPVKERNELARKSLAARKGGSVNTGAGSAPDRPSKAQAPACSPEMIVRQDDPRPQVGMADLSGYRLASESPLAVVAAHGTLFTTTVPGAGKAGDIQWHDSNPTPERDVLAVLAREQQALDREEDRIATCSNACCTTARDICAVLRDNRARIVGWLRCVAERAGLAVPPVAVRKPATPPASYWGLAGSRLFLGFPVSTRRTRETLPHGGPVSSPVLLTGPSAAAVLANMNVKYRTASGHLAYVSDAELLRGEYMGPRDRRFAVLDKSCGPGFASYLIDSSLRDGFPGESRIVAIGCGDSALAAMSEALSTCEGLGGCTSRYSGHIQVVVEVAKWDGTLTGAIAGGGGAADVSSTNRSIGGCGAEGAGASLRVGPISPGPGVDERTCRTLFSRLR